MHKLYFHYGCDVHNFSHVCEAKLNNIINCMSDLSAAAGALSLRSLLILLSTLALSLLIHMEVLLV